MSISAPQADAHQYQTRVVKFWARRLPVMPRPAHLPLAGRLWPRPRRREQPQGPHRRPRLNHETAEVVAVCLGGGETVSHKPGTTRID